MQLGVTFANLRNRNIDLSPVVAGSPEPRKPPQITRENVLRLAGFFPTKPLQVQFRLLALQRLMRKWSKA
jgi:hypothetical protein